jgi:hypothetical protein
MKLFGTAAGFFLMTLAWYAISHFSYLHLFPAAPQTPNLKLLAKLLEAFFLMSLWSFPFILKTLEKFIFEKESRASKLTTLSSLLTFIVTEGLLMALFGFVPVLICLCLLSLYAWVCARDHPDRSFPQTPILSLFWGVLFSIILVAILISGFRHTPLPPIDLYHDGSMLFAVSDFLKGKSFFREISFFYGPLREVGKPLLAFLLHGETYLAISELTRWLEAMGPALVFWLVWEICERRWMALVFGGILLLRTDLFLPDRVLPALFAAGFFFRAIKRSHNGKQPFLSRIWMTASGLSLLFQLLYSFEVGITLLSGFIVYAGVVLFIYRKKEEDLAILRFQGYGFLLGGVLLFGFFLFNGGIVKFITDQINLLAFGAPTWTDLYHSHMFAPKGFGLRGFLRVFIGLHISPILSMGVVSYVLFQIPSESRDYRRSNLLALASINFFLFFLYISAPDSPHWKTATVFYWVLLAGAAEEALNWLKSPDSHSLRRWESVILSSLIVLPCLSAFLGRNSIWSYAGAGIAKWNSLSPPEETTPHHRGILVPPRLGNYPGSQEKLEQIRDVVAALQSIVPVNGYFFDVSNYGGYYFLANRMNSTRFGLINHIHGPWMLKECLADLKSHPPAAVLVELDQGHIVCQDRYKPVIDYLVPRYKIVKRIQHLAVLEPKKTPSS